MGYRIYCSYCCWFKGFWVLNSNVLNQVSASVVSLFNENLPLFNISGDSVFNNIVLLLGTISSLMYFYFSKEQRGNFGKLTRVGIYFLMISFGASFGFAVMGRISLLVGRFRELITYSEPSYNYSTIWLLFLIVAFLIYHSIREKESNT